jgi:hypothetical protein
MLCDLCNKNPLSAGGGIQTHGLRVCEDCYYSEAFDEAKPLPNYVVKIMSHKLDEFRRIIQQQEYTIGVFEGRITPQPPDESGKERARAFWNFGKSPRAGYD